MNTLNATRRARFLAVTLAERVDAQAIVAVTRGGFTARSLSALRPRMPIVAATDRPETARRLALFWGLIPIRTGLGESADASGSIIAGQLIDRRLIDPGATIVLLSISDDLGRADANYVKIQRV